MRFFIFRLESYVSLRLERSKNGKINSIKQYILYSLCSLTINVRWCAMTTAYFCNYLLIIVDRITLVRTTSFFERGFAFIYWPNLVQQNRIALRNRRTHHKYNVQNEKWLFFSREKIWLKDLTIHFETSIRSLSVNYGMQFTAHFFNITHVCIWAIFTSNQGIFSLLFDCGNNLCQNLESGRFTVMNHLQRYCRPN